MANILHSFEELGEVFGVRGKKPRPEKEFTCKVCGGKMKHINNVLICENPHKRKDAEGKEIYFQYNVCQKIRRTPSRLLAPGEVFAQ